MSCQNVLYISNDNDLVVEGLQLSENVDTDDYIEDANITATVKNAAGATVATVTLTHDVNGTYRGFLSSGTTLTEGEIYTIIYQASNYGYKVTKTAIARVRTE